jgi:hypothetical protein
MIEALWGAWGQLQGPTDNPSGRIEHNYLAIFGDAELWGKPKNPAIFDIDQSIHVIKVGLNYRFPMWDQIRF